jgi:hypothetical protein
MRMHANPHTLLLCTTLHGDGLVPYLQRVCAWLQACEEYLPAERPSEAGLGVLAGRQVAQPPL